MATVSRKINWVSSLQNEEAIDELAKSLQQFYSSDNSAYFSSSNEATAENWIQQHEWGYKKISELAENATSICEVGCGRSNMLKHFPSFRTKYTGLDFFKKMLNENAANYPGAKFFPFVSPEIFPVENEKFDLVFCVFVMEHVTRPAVFLDECKRILKPGGKLVILCPHYLAFGRMTSQRAGYSKGNANDKLKRYKLLDAIVTLFDNRIRIPFVCRQYAKKADRSPLFLVNCSPVLFADDFKPDADAVYVTYKKEMVSYLQESFNEIENDSKLIAYELKNRVIFLQMQKQG
jgi:SAM-dependent methyltransferase